MCSISFNNNVNILVDFIFFVNIVILYGQPSCYKNNLQKTKDSVIMRFENIFKTIVNVDISIKIDKDQIYGKKLLLFIVGNDKDENSRVHFNAGKIEQLFPVEILFSDANDSFVIRDTTGKIDRRVSSKPNLKPISYLEIKFLPGHFRIDYIVSCDWLVDPYRSLLEVVPDSMVYSQEERLEISCSFTCYGIVRVTWYLADKELMPDQNNIIVTNKIKIESIPSLSSTISIKLTFSTTLLGNYTCNAQNEFYSQSETDSVVPDHVNYQSFLGAQAVKPKPAFNYTVQKLKLIDVHEPENFEFGYSRCVIFCKGEKPITVYSLLQVEEEKNKEISLITLYLKIPDRVTPSYQYNCSLTILELTEALNFVVELCGKGSYVDEGSCRTCPNGQTSNAQTTLKCFNVSSECAMNYYGYGNVCTVCPLSLDTKGVVNATNASQCEEAISTCVSGEYGVGSECLHCPIGMTSSNNTAVKVEDCFNPPDANCVADHYGWGNVSKCMPCPEGSSALHGGAVKEHDCFVSCPPGFYGDVLGCYKCPKNKTSVYGNNTEYTHCICEEGYESVNQACVPCPYGDCGAVKDEVSAGSNIKYILFVVSILLTLILILTLLIVTYNKMKEEDATIDDILEGYKLKMQCNMKKFRGLFARNKVMATKEQFSDQEDEGYDELTDT